MDPRLKRKLESLVAKALVALSGVKGYFAKVFCQKILVIFWRIFKFEYKEKKNEKVTEREEVKEKKYEETLKDGVTEKAQRDATLDFLNGG